jgi:hypothetical protein
MILDDDNEVIFEWLCRFADARSPQFATEPSIQHNEHKVLSGY